MSTVTQAREDVAVSTVAAPRGCGDVGRPIRLPAALADGTPPLVPSAAHADARVADPQLGAAVAPLLLAPAGREPGPDGVRDVSTGPRVPG